MPASAITTIAAQFPGKPLPAGNIHVRLPKMAKARRGRMPHRTATTRTAHAARVIRNASALLSAVLLSVALTGCASESFMVFGDSGKYQYHNCEQLAAAAKRQSDRERELKELIDKSEQAAGGVIVSMMAYRSDYLAVNEDLRVIEATQRSKNCQTPATWQSNSAIR